jgi:dipeptidyl aminopeptidase/acylaminoacyl peptidase
MRTGTAPGIVPRFPAVPIAITAALVWLASPLVAQQADDAGLPPLIDRELFFGDPQIAGAEMSPDGRWISFLRPYRDVMNVWVKKRGEPFDAARPVTADAERPIRIYFWTEDSRSILFLQDAGGNENYHLWAVDPGGEAVPDTGVPEARDLTPIEGVRAAVYALPEAAPNRIIVGLNDRDPALHDVYALDIDTGRRELLIRNDSNVGQWVADLDGNVRLAWRQTPDGGSEMLRVENGALGEVIYSCGDEEQCVPYRFHRNGRQVYIESNKGDEVDLSRLLLMDARTGATELVESDPEGEVDFGDAVFSDASEELIGTVYVGDRQRIYPRTEEFSRDLAFLRRSLPDGELGIASGTEDERFWIVAVSRDVSPGQVYLYDRREARAEKLYDVRPELPPQHMASMQPVRYRARDGASIPAYLTIPTGLAARKLPVVLLPHGGPWGRDTWGFDSFAQFLANRGYAVFQPNFRGSAGYGKDFLNAGNEQWGTGVMQHDLSDAVAYLVSRGVADPRRVAILGGSYGGYATLAGVTFTPDLYAAGVSIVGPSNIITLLRSIPPYWGPIKKIFHKRVGDPDDPDDRVRLEEQSPFYHADRIKAPLLVIQGANDPRVKRAESDQIVVAMRDLGRQVEYLVAPDEGHGFAGEENRLAMFAVIEEFLAKHVGGRYQTGASPAVAQRIDALRVDVGTVAMPEAPGPAAREAATGPLPEADATLLAPLTLSYVAEVAVAGGTLTLESTRTMAREDLKGIPAWRVETVMKTPGAEARDVTYLALPGLRPLRRSVSQGPVRIELEFSDVAVTGSMRAMGQEIAVDVELEAPVFGSDAALEATLCALPLAPGYGAVLRTFDIQTQSVRVLALRVVGTEIVEVPAGTFDSFKATVETVGGEGGGGVIWISRDAPRAVVRSERTLPAQGGGGTVVQRLASRTAG